MAGDKAVATGDAQALEAQVASQMKFLLALQQANAKAKVAATLTSSNVAPQRKRPSLIDAKGASKAAATAAAAAAATKPTSRAEVVPESPNIL